MMSGSELQFSVAEVPEVPRVLQFERDADWGASILADGVYQTSGKILFEGTVQRIREDLLLDLRISLPVHFHCSRCGEHVALDYQKNFKHLFVRGAGEEVSLPLDVDLDPELDISEFSGNQCDAGPVVLGALAADLPAYPVCLYNCEIPSTGENTRETTAPAIDPRLAPLLAIKQSMAQDPGSTPNEA
jgi:uncharacterized metal-binding protein YceD (DUF177 family)